jgi:membrane protein
MFRTFAIPISWGELVKRTIRETNADDCLGLAAQLAYYMLLALVPALVFMLALTSFFPFDTVQQVVTAMRAFAPGDMTTIIEEQMRRIAQGQNGGLLTFGIAMALWSSSAAVVAIVGALNRAYDIEEGRPWWKVRLVAIGLTLALSAFVIVAFALVVAGPLLGRALAGRLGLGGAFEPIWAVLQWPLAFALVAVAVAFINYFAPDAEQDWEWVTPGAVLATVLWVVASLAFKFYLSRFADYNATYGSLGGVIVLMLWFYLSGLAVLIGAEMNAEIEHASPYGKDVGEKVPGEKKKLGAAAARAYEKRQREGALRSPRPERWQPAAPAIPAAAVSRRMAEPSLGEVVLAFILSRFVRRRENRAQIE